MGIPILKRRKFHFKSIEYFPYCIQKHFKPLLSRVLTEKDEEYGGLKETFRSFQDKIYQKLVEHPIFGKKLDPTRFDIGETTQMKHSEFIQQIFGNYLEQNGQDAASNISVSFDRTYVDDYMGEINDYITY